MILKRTDEVIAVLEEALTVPAPQPCRLRSGPGAA